MSQLAFYVNCLYGFIPAPYDWLLAVLYGKPAAIINSCKVLTLYGDFSHHFNQILFRNLNFKDIEYEN